jgi:hypothetical protein
MKLLQLAGAVVLVVLPASLALPAHAADADVTGDWKIDGSVFFNDIKTTCHFKKTGDSTVGTCDNDAGPGEYTPVTISGGKVGWSWNPGPALLTFDAALTSATAMKGKITVRGFSGSFTATKQ